MVLVILRSHSWNTVFFMGCTTNGTSKVEKHYYDVFLMARIGVSYFVTFAKISRISTLLQTSISRK